MSTEQAKEYLARVVPWPQEGEAPTFVNIHWTFVPPDLEPGRKAPWTGRACRSLNEAVRAIEYALKNSTTRDIYACMSSQRTATEKTAARSGGKYFTPVRSQANAAYLKSLFIDIDFKGGDHGYDTPDEAVTSLGNFLAKSNMPKPSLIVSSGGGMHVYWTLARALTPPEWNPLAFALAEATKQLGLKCDTQCTIDAARVLRVPDTFNRKTEPPRPVRLTGGRTDFDYAVDRIWAALEPYRVAAPITKDIDPSLFPSRPPITGDSALAMGVDMGRAAPIKLDELKSECGFIRDALDTGGAAFTNPLWNLTTLIATFTDNPRADAHRMANKHPGYTQESTDELFDRKEREKEAKGLGWPACRTISGSGCKLCQSCVHFAAGKSPLHFTPRNSPTPNAGGGNLPGNVAGVGNGQAGGAPSGTQFGGPPQPAVSQSDLPTGYVRRADGVVLKITTREDGQQDFIPICKYPMQDPWLQVSPWALHFTTILDSGRQKKITLPFTDVSDDAGMRSTLWAQGVPLRKGETSMTVEFVVSWIEKLQKTKGMTVSSVPFGWNTAFGKIDGFCFGGHVWSPNGERQAASPDFVIAQQYEPTGAIEPWITAAKMVTQQKRPALDAVIAASFGAPLVRFTGQTGLLMSLYSIESGIGKSTALKIAQAVWGDPIKAMQGLSDTQNSVVNKIGEIRSLPLFWDELKTEDDTKKFVNLAFQLSLGKEKSRLTQSSQQRNPGTWQTILVSASNESLLDFVLTRTKMTTAGLYRVFEYEVPPAIGAQVALADAQSLLGALHDNYGIVGLEFAKFLGAHHARLNSEVNSYFKNLETELRIQPDERFWAALITCVCLGAKYSNELKFTEIDEEGLKQFMITTLAGMRSERASQPVDMKDTMNVSNILAQFLNEMRARHTLYTNRIHTSKGKPSGIVVKRDASRLESVYVHVGLDQKLMRISSTKLSNWLGDNNYSRHIFNRALEREFKAKTVRGFIGSGTQYAVASEYLVEIDLNNSPHANFIDEA